MGRKEEKMLSVKETAEKLGASESSVRVWVWRGRFAGARKESTPLGDYWLIPESALVNFEMGRPGPKPKTKSNGDPIKTSKKASSKKAKNN
jgi:hypothetical protein